MIKYLQAPFPQIRRINTWHRLRTGQLTVTVTLQVLSRLQVEEGLGHLVAAAVLARQVAAALGLQVAVDLEDPDLPSQDFLTHNQLNRPRNLKREEAPLGRRLSRNNQRSPLRNLAPPQRDPLALLTLQVRLHQGQLEVLGHPLPLPARSELPLRPRPELSERLLQRPLARSALHPQRPLARLAHRPQRPLAHSARHPQILLVLLGRLPQPLLARSRLPLRHLPARSGLPLRLLLARSGLHLRLLLAPLELPPQLLQAG